MNVLEKPLNNAVRIIAGLLLFAATGASAETPEERLAAAGHELPEPTSPVATY